NQQIGVGVGAVVGDAVTNVLVRVLLVGDDLGQQTLGAGQLFHAARRRYETNLLIRQLFQSRMFEVRHGLHSFAIAGRAALGSRDRSGQRRRAGSSGATVFGSLPLLLFPSLSAEPAASYFVRWGHPLPTEKRLNFSPQTCRRFRVYLLDTPTRVRG